MTPADDDLEELNLYLAECREHLATIETDLLSIEEAGAQIDEKLVNRVFRAAHSIKGGAGFFGLSKIQELGHKTENILDLIRSREMVPSPEVVNILLLAFDRLRAMINSPQESNRADISEYMESLTNLTSSSLPASEKASLTRHVELVPHSGGSLIRVAEFDLSRAEKRDEYVYLVELDLIHDVQRREKTPWEVFRDYQAAGTIIECALNLAAVGTLEDEPSSKVPLEILFSTIIDPSFIEMLFEGLPKEQVRLIQSPKNPQAPMRRMLPGESVFDLAVVEQPAAAVELPEEQPMAIERLAPVERQPVVIERSVVEKPPVAVPPPAAAHPAAETTETQIEETLRVNVKLLESLMNLAGELVLSRNQMLEAIRRGNKHDMRTSGQRVSLVTSELQETIMLTRMQPIGNVFTKFPRVVRDMARDLKKEVQLEIYGKEVELDKTIIEGLSEPLTHMVRNALDHGIESREARVAAKKDPVGKLIIKAFYTAGQVIVEISDDGQGIDAQRVVASAVKKSLVTPDQAQSMSEKEKMALIFLPGLSTAEKVSGISGRGVGMDVVKTNLDRLGGKIDIESGPGLGTTFRISLPLTLAIIPSLLISVGEERFAIPQINISELIHVPAAQVKDRIEVVGDAEVLVLRGKLVPIIHLADLLGIERMYQDPETGETLPERRQQASDRRSPHSELLGLPAPEAAAPAALSERRATSDRRYHVASDLEIAVISSGTLEYGLIVDRLHDTAEIVVRPLGRHMKQCVEYGGATILGDGCVAVILDVSGLATKANLTSMAGSARARQLEQEISNERKIGQQALLLFRNAADEHCAIPLEVVTRVERIEADQVENLGGKRSMQYRDATLPLVTLQDAAQVGAVSSSSDLAVIVFNTGEREMGLLAAMPVDAVEEAVKIDRYTLRQKGVAGSAIIHDKTTLIVDIDELVEASGWANKGAVNAPALAPTSDALPEVLVPQQPQARVSNGVTILLAEDSDFFRRQVRKYLEEDGYTVLVAEDGQEAWEKLEAHAGIVNLVVTDIEMPNLNGLDLTRRIRANPQFADLPIVALTSLASQDEVELGRAAGVTAYQIKLDRETLLDNIRALMANAY